MGILDNLKSIQHCSARLIVEELLRNNINTYAVSPGARSIPFIYALHERQDVNIHLFNDERSAAFWAQGYAKGSGRPAVLLATSGTAVANYLPGVIEASLSSLPLIIITCDRPWELKYAKANQTISQADIFSEYVKLKINLPAPENSVYPESLLANIDQLAAVAKTSPAGPVHLNIAFRKPFEESNFKFDNIAEREIIQSWEKSASPFCRFSSLPPGPNLSEVHDISDKIKSAEKIAIIAGPLISTNHSAIVELAKKIGAPILADINSSLRGQENVFALYNKWEEALIEPDLILYFGDRIISDKLRGLINKSKEAILVTEYPGRQDAIENEFLRFHQKITSTPEEFAKALNSTCANKPTNILISIFECLEEKAQNKINNLPASSEARMVRTIIESAPEAIYLSSSLILREAEYFALPAAGVTTNCNRGAVGIDGVLSSACGYSCGSNKVTFLLIGDQALQHDLTALNFLRNSRVHVFLINNSGGAIFNILPCEEIQPILRNSQEIDFSSAAKAYNLNYLKISSEKELIMRISSLKSLSYGSITEIPCLGIESAKLLKY